MLGLLELPSDLFYLALGYIDPLDLIHLSKTCRIVYEALSERQIWVDALKRTCRQAELFEPTFHPLHDLDLEALKKACMRPNLLEKKLLSKEGSLSPAFETTLAGDDLGQFGMFHLVPGGRYILAAGYTRISLWDLGQPQSSSESPAPPFITPCSTLTPPGENRVFKRVSGPSPHDTAFLRFVGSVVDSDPSSLSVRKLCVFEVGPLPGNCEIRIVAELALEDFEDRVQHNWISGDKAYFRLLQVGNDDEDDEQDEDADEDEDESDYDDRIAVWDFVNSRLAVWAMRMPEVFPHFMNLDDYVIALHGDGTHAWKTPPLEKIDRSYVLEIGGNEVLNEPIYVRHQDEEITSQTTLLVPTRWYSSSTSTVVQIHSGTAQIRLSLEVVDGVLVTKSSPCAPLRPLLEENDTLQSAHIVLYSHSDRLQIMGTGYSFQPDHASFFASDFPATERGWKGRRFTFSRADNGSWFSHVCPGSGRYAYSYHQIGGDPRIHVVNLMKL